MQKKILVLGGYGVYGGRISRALAADPAIDCIVAGRHPPSKSRDMHSRTSYVKLDINSFTSLRTTLPGMFAVVNAIGPFNANDYRIAEQCAELGIHYVDLADTREYVAGFHRLNRKAQQTGALLVTGAGYTPAVSTMLVDSIQHDFDKIKELHVLVSPGNKSPRGRAALHSLMQQVGSPVRMKSLGRWQQIYAWTKGQKIHFPKPVGKRRVYLSNASELDIFPQRYGVQTASFYTGFELNTFNFGLSLLSYMKRHRKQTSVTGLARSLRFIGKWFKGLGSASDAYGIVAKGERAGQEVTHAIYLVARDGNGSMIPCSPSVALIKRWVKHGVRQSGASACLDLLVLDDIKAILIDYDIVIVRA